MLHGRNDLNLAPDEYAGFSMTLLRMFAFKPDNGTSNDANNATNVRSVEREMPVVAQQVTQSVASFMQAAVTKSELSPARAALAAVRNLGKTPSSSMMAGVKSPDLIPNVPVLAKATNTTVTSLESDNHVVMWQPVSVLNWDGNWPQLAASLPLRGVAQQLVLQAELIECKVNNDAQACFHLKVPLETLCSSVNIDKLIVALSTYFGQEINVKTEVGAVRHTAHAQAQQDILLRQRQAEDNIHNDSFVRTLMHEFDANVVPGSIKSI